MNRKGLQELAKERLADAKLLLDNGRYAGAYYLCGYAIECALKACISKQTRIHDFPPEPKVVSQIYTHDLNTLVIRAGLDTHLDIEKKSDPSFAIYWTLVKDWSERTRYETRSSKEARDLYQAIADRNRGVMRWVRQFW